MVFWENYTIFWNEKVRIWCRTLGSVGSVGGAKMWENGYSISVMT